MICKFGSLSCINVERVTGIEPALSAWEFRSVQPWWSVFIPERSLRCGYVAASSGPIRSRPGEFALFPNKIPNNSGEQRRFGASIIGGQPWFTVINDALLAEFHRPRPSHLSLGRWADDRGCWVFVELGAGGVAV
jgi:hypothetical protein